MGSYKKEEIVGYVIEEKITCDECMTKEDYDNLTNDMIITERDCVDELVFCDECGKKIYS